MAEEKSIVEKLKEIVNPEPVTTDDIEEEVWKDLSHLYYKYEDERQKEAFRNIMKQISHKIESGNWKSVYQKMYRLEHDE
jgi:hypothetical protein